MTKGARSQSEMYTDNPGGKRGGGRTEIEKHAGCNGCLKSILCLELLKPNLGGRGWWGTSCRVIISVGTPEFDGLAQMSVVPANIPQ